MKKFRPYFELTIPKDYSPDERKAIAAEIIDYVVTRTENGIDANGKPFKKYSKKYAEEKGQSNVDLTYSAEMLSEIQLLNDKSGLIRIGYDSGSDVVPRVEGNCLGTYGNDTPLKGKARNFLGITNKDLKAILSNYPLKDKDERRERVDLVRDADIIARDIVSRSGFDEDSE